MSEKNYTIQLTDFKEGVGGAALLGAVGDAVLVLGQLLHVVDELGGGRLGQQRGQVRGVRARDHQREQPPHARHCARPVCTERMIGVSIDR